MTLDWRGRGLLAGLTLTLVACGGATPDQSRTGSSKAALDRPATLAAVCSGCHAGPSAAIVSLDGMSAETLSSSIQRYRTETDGTTVMHRLARGYGDEDIEAVSAYLAAHPAQVP